MWNASVRILRLRGKNMYYMEYLEWGKYSNEISLFVYWEYAEWICLYTENTQNESVHILSIRRTGLFVYWEYAERICTTENTRNEVNRSVCILRICRKNMYYGEYSNEILLFVHWEYMEWICSYTENTRIESVRILCIHGTDLYVYWEKTRNTQKVEYLGKFETKIEIFLGRFIKSLDGFDWLYSISLKTKKSHASVPKGTVKACCNLKGHLNI